MIAYYVNVADERDQRADMQIVRSHTVDGEEPVDVGYDFRRALAETVCEQVLSKYNLSAVTVTIKAPEFEVTLSPLALDPLWVEDEA